jgi:hypothetical protein
MKFTYKLNSIGWADVHLRIGNSEIYISPSYLSEPLIDLVRSIELLLPECTPSDEAKSVVQFEWDSEPAIHSWRIEKTSIGIVQIEITCYDDGIKTTPGKIEFKEECDLNQFIIQVVYSLETLLKNHGLIGYRKQWHAQDFPISSYLQLKYYLLNKSSFPVTFNNPDEWIERIESKLNEEIELINKRIL